MKIYALCPVSDKNINERVSRINGIFTVLLLILTGLIPSIVPVIFLAIDFFLRASDHSKFSLIGISSKAIIKYFGVNENLINAGPKIFAARLGFIFSGLILFCFFLNAYLLAVILAGVLGILSLLEAAFGLCVACEIYPYVYRWLYNMN
jgi:hypothetical protein